LQQPLDVSELLVDAGLDELSPRLQVFLQGEVALVETFEELRF
jgi:hypothetical protein